MNAARKAGVHVRIEFCDGGIVATTVDEATAKPNMSADDELANWRRKKRHVRINAKGMHWTVAKLADGKRKTYATRGAGASAQRRVWLAGIHRQLQRCHRHKVVVPEGKLLSLLQGYQASQDFLGLRDRTRADYIEQIEKIEKKFGDAASRRSPPRGRAASSWIGATS